MLQLKSLFAKLLANMGTIALVGLLVYVAFTEFIRPSMTAAAVDESLENVKQAVDETARMRADVDAGLKRLDRATSLNSGLLQQNKSLVDTLRLLQDDLLTKKAALDVREQQLRTRYESQKTTIRNAQKQVK
ncbi:hypothetical protein ACAW74_18085 [Fibrella sp. WM1]|uniref:hypothetical protein n=1 Tax=Fibrella musci TaxID=3242485 RepID=UPI003522E612